MVTVVPGDNSWSDAFKGVGSGLAQGYTNRSDENAIQKAISELPQDASARQILDTVTGVKTHSPEAKQNAFKNYLGVKNFEEMQRKAKAQEDLVREKLEAKNQPSEKQQAQDEAFDVGLGTIDRMREIRKKGNLGLGSGVKKYLGGETAKDFGEYEQLGKSLIQLSTMIPIRNRQEFEALAHNLYDPTITDKQAEGVLNALEGFISRSVGKRKAAEQPQEVKRPPLAAFEGKK